jgi:hypothetical protein
VVRRVFLHSDDEPGGGELLAFGREDDGIHGSYDA